MNNDLFYIGLKGVFCFKPPYPQLCELVIPPPPPPSPPSPVISGQAVFGGGHSLNKSYSSLTSIYTYSTNLMIAGGNLSYLAAAGAAAGNSTIGVFGSGSTELKVLEGNMNLYVYFSPTMTSSVSLYNYSNNTSTSGYNLTYKARDLAAAGNSTLGVFGAGKTSLDVYVSTTSIYTYSSNTQESGDYLSYSNYNLAAAGNSTLGVFGGGEISLDTSISNYSYTTSLYNYSSNLASFGTNLVYGSSSLSAAGNSQVSLFAGGTDNPSTSLYVYSTNTTVSGSNMFAGGAENAGTGNSIYAIFGGNTGSDVLLGTWIYNYSSNVVQNSTSLVYLQSRGMACSSGNVGVIS